MKKNKLEQTQKVTAGMAPLQRQVICLDFDGTFTAAPELWIDFIKLAKTKGHKIICATMRYKHEGDEVLKHLEKHCDEIIFTNRKAKLPFLLRQGVVPTIWIDDNPKWIYTNSIFY